MQATTQLGSHLCRCARERLALGHFKKASLLLAEAKQQILMAEARELHRRRARAKNCIARAALNFYRTKLARIVRLKGQVGDGLLSLVSHSFCFDGALAQAREQRRKWRAPA